MVDEAADPPRVELGLPVLETGTVAGRRDQSNDKFISIHRMELQLAWVF